MINERFLSNFKDSDLPFRVQRVSFHNTKKDTQYQFNTKLIKLSNIFTS
jgi:hypothetical protein